MPYIIPETMPADWIADFAIDDTTGDVADAMRIAYDNALKRQGLDSLMGRLRAACLAAAEGARRGPRPGLGLAIDAMDAAVKADWQDWPDNAADHT